MLKSPLYSPPGETAEDSLGAAEVEGPKGGMSPPDPLGLLHEKKGKK